MAAFHDSVNVAGWFVALFAGEARAGAAGAAGIVVKPEDVEYALVPPAFDALTCQKYVVPFDNGPTDCDVPVSVESSTTVVVNDELVDTWSRYVEAPVDAFHDNVNVVGWFVALFAGEASVGAGGGVGGGAAVVKLTLAEKPLVTSSSEALTCQ